MKYEDSDVLTLIKGLTDRVITLERQMLQMRSTSKKSSEPSLYMEYNGYTLEHALNAMLKKWDSGDANWPVETGLKSQANRYGISLETLHDLIRTQGMKKMRARFASYALSGYTEKKEDSDANP